MIPGDSAVESWDLVGKSRNIGGVGHLVLLVFCHVQVLDFIKVVVEVFESFLAFFDGEVGLDRVFLVHEES